ncbi:hypothetical protein FO440_18355 [Mucilaginibacter corticis]|uniref:Uncharacterized protein n=1 Tax=Mucilaginibacter corticis TaxID=2597670 RepID=A0A556MIF8_9SPHI|nr:hypothetical protein [Mucilaginibacter corticis]TSJ39701.1 hypothetical protein FO440_18355 [Mucilaginibacter corticis]
MATTDPGPPGEIRTFDYGDAVEIYDHPYHRVPFSERCWLSQNQNLNLISNVIICSSGMEAVAFNYFHPKPANVLFLSMGIRPNNHHFRWINENLQNKSFILVFGNTPLDKATELIVAAAICQQPLTIRFSNELAIINFRRKAYRMSQDELRLSSFSRLSGYRFNCKTASPKDHENYLAQWRQRSLSNQFPSP